MGNAALNMPTPSNPKIYHIVHIDRLSSIITDRHLWCDAEINRRSSVGTTIGLSGIKQRRLRDLYLASYPDLRVGDCVPFYFCPRSVMLFLIHKANYAELTYRDGQTPIVHLEADLMQTVAWATQNSQRWAFTLSNAGSLYFEDRCDLSDLGDINWDAVNAKYWADVREPKQAEFLIEHSFPWELVSRIGVHSQDTYAQVVAQVRSSAYKPRVEIKPDWYY